MTEYYIPTRESETEFVEKRSRFIGHVWRVESEEEARTLIEATKKKHYDARHNCWCYVIKDGPMRYSDDGEPQGTAGQPMLNVFQREGVVNVCCVVTRYFGGTLLGTGGLVHAYTRAARMAVEAAEIVTRARLAILSVTVNYSDYQKILPLIEAGHIRVDDSEFAGNVTLTLALRWEDADGFMKRLSDVCNGRAACRIAGDRFDYL